MKNKGIIILGAPASGKSTLIYNLWGNINIKDFYIFNQDQYVEDKLHPCYNNPLMAYNWMYKIEFPKIIKTNTNFVLDTTGSNINTLRKITENPNYQFKAVIVYCNPIIAFIRNFSRERKLPKQVLLECWLKVYSQIKDYQYIFGIDNIYIYETEYTDEEKSILLKYDYLEEYLQDNPNNYTSSFKKETTIYTPEQIEKKEKQFLKIIDKVQGVWNIDIIRDNFLSQNEVWIEDIKEELNKWIT